MSPFWSRKRRFSRAGQRRRELVERERRRYERERAGAEIEAETAVEAEPTSPAQDAEPKRRPLLPETARRTSRSRPRGRSRRRVRPDLGGLRSASSSGAGATVRHARPGLARLADRTARLLGWLLALVFRLAGRFERAILAIADTALSVGERLIAVGERELTPRRMLVLVIVVCGGLLVYSQFVAYRGVEVGQPDYSQVSSIAPAPQTARVKAGAAHAYALIPIAVLAVGIAVAALISGRWKMGRLIALLGLVGVAISLAIDLPKGLDAGTAGTAFAGAQATLTDGFYAQLSASAILILCGWLLAAQLRGSEARGWTRGRRKGTAHPRGAPSVAGGGA